MNNTDFSPKFDSPLDLEDKMLTVPPHLQLGAQLAVAAYIAYPYIASPLVVDKLKGVAKGVFSGFSYLFRKSGETYERLIPGKVKQGVALAGEWSDYLLHKGIMTIEEATDFANFGGTKDPQASILKSRGRLDQHDEEFGRCCEFLADQAAGYFLRNEEKFKAKVSTAVKEMSYPFLGDFAGWFLNLSKELIAQTIKANILHVLANLADQGFDPEHSFGDKQGNPFGRVISVIGVCLSENMMRLKEIEGSSADQQPDLFRQLFQDVSGDLLAKLFPKGAEDIQLFHPYAPFMKLIKEIVWKLIHQKLPGLLEELYLETRPLSMLHPHWQKQFDDEAQGLKAEQLVNLPSSLFQQFIRGHIDPMTDDQVPALENWLKEKGVDKSADLSPLLMKYAKEFLLTQDTSLAAIGQFLETYLMERFLFNLSNYTPDEVDTPMPLYILQKWIEGDCFKMVRSCLSGKTESANQAMPGALHDLLAPFGLDRKETFPLPSFILDKIWPEIEKFQEDALPKLLLGAFPEWTVLSGYSNHKQKCSVWLDDPALIDSCRNMTKLMTAQGIDLFADPELSPFSILNDFLPSHPLSSDQEECLDDQLADFLDKDNQSLAILIDFAEQCAEAFIFQVCHDLYEQFEVAAAHDGLDDPFEEGGTPPEDVPIDSFPVWFAKEAAEALQDLSPDQFSDEERAAFRQALKLLYSARFSDDPAMQKQFLKEFDKQWELLAPKFEEISKNLLERLGYNRPEELPFPRPLQQLIWDKIHSILPKKVFEEAGSILEPLLEFEMLREEVQALPHGNQLAEGCKFLAQDIVEHLPEWEEEIVDQFSEGIKQKIPDFEIGEPTKALLLLHLRFFISQENGVYDPLWNLIEDYLEGMLLKFVVKLSHLNQDDLQSIKKLIIETRDQMIALEDDHEAIALQFADHLVQILGVEGEEDLFGIPQGIRELALKEVKKKFAKGFLAFYRLEDKIRNQTIDEAAVGKYMSISNISETVLILTHYILDKGTDQLSSKDEEGELEILPKLVPSLNHLLEKLSQKNYQSATLFQGVIAKGIPFPYLGRLFEILDDPQNKPYKEQLADWINPFLTNQVASKLLLMLVKEQEESPYFDKALLLGLLPLLTRHLQHLKEASLKEGGLNLPNFLETVGDDGLHPALQDEEQGRAIFYQEQSALIFKVIFPNGKKDLIPLLSDFPLKGDHLDLLWEMAQTTLSLNLPKALEALFNEEFLVLFFDDLFAEIVEKLEHPLIFKKGNASEVQPLFDEEDEENLQLDFALGEFILEVVRFVELPALQLKFPAWLRKMAGGKAMEKKLIVAIGSVARKKFDKELLPTVLKRVLRKLAKKEHIKMTKAEKIEAKEQQALDTKKWERKIAEISAEFVIRMAGAKIGQAAESSQHPLLRIFLKAFLTICSFIFIHILGPLFRFLKLDKAFIEYLYALIDHATSKTIGVLSEPALHEDLVFSGVEAFEEVLLKPNG